MCQRCLAHLCITRPKLYQASFDGFTDANINSQTRSQNVEFNDTISWKNFTFNLGLLVSQDTLYGQGLKRNPDNISGLRGC